MKRILVFGMYDKFGGIEAFIYNIIRNSNPKLVHYDLIVITGDVGGHNPFIDKVRDFYDGNARIFKIVKFKKNPLKALSESIILAKQTHGRYDAIYCNSAEASVMYYMLPFVVGKNSPKFVVHSHSSFGNRPMQNKIFKPLLNKYADVCWACSKKAAKWQFGKKKHVQLIKVGIETNRFCYSASQRSKIRDLYNLDDNCLVIGNVGRLSAIKNQTFLLSVSLILKKRGISFKLILIGDGEMREEIESKIESEDLSDQVILTGNINNVEDYLCAMDIFVMPSLFEGLPTVGIEAQSEGLACLFSDTIDEQILITEVAKMIPLNNDANYWADEILKIEKNDNRDEYSRIIREKGYDVFRVAQAVNDYFVTEE